MNPVIVLLALTIAVNGLLEGLTVDAALAIVPIHRCTDSIAYATFPRGNDFENGVVISPLLRIRATLLTVLAAFLPRQSAHQYGDCSTLFPFHKSVRCVSSYARGRRRECYESF